MLTKFISLKRTNISSHKRLKNKPCKVEEGLKGIELISVAANLGLNY